MPIRIFRAEPMKATLFAAVQVPAELAKIDVEYVPEASGADIVLAREFSQLLPYAGAGKRLAVFTHEPRLCTAGRSIVTPEGFSGPVHVMNLYTRNVFTDGLFYAHPLEGFDPEAAIATFRTKPKRAIMLASYVKADAARLPMHGLDSAGGNDVDIDLYDYRQRLAVHLLEQKPHRFELFGRSWPKHIETINTRNVPTGWHEDKKQRLAGFRYNVCLENTRWPFYISEKIWDALANGCLPIYHGTDNHIYSLLPKGGPIEVTGKTVEQVTDEMFTTPGSEEEDRFAACARAVGRLSNVAHRKRSGRALTARIAMFLEMVASTR